MIVFRECPPFIVGSVTRGQPNSIHLDRCHGDATQWLRSYCTQLLTLPTTILPDYKVYYTILLLLLLLLLLPPPTTILLSVKKKECALRHFSSSSSSSSAFTTTITSTTTTTLSSPTKKSSSLQPLPYPPYPRSPKTPHASASVPSSAAVVIPQPAPPPVPSHLCSRFQSYHLRDAHHVGLDGPLHARRLLSRISTLSYPPGRCDL